MAEQQTPTLSKVVGVLGGMGPAATVDFYAKLVRHTPAQRDQDHLRVVIWADPTVPSRQQALLAGGTDPTPWLEEGVRHLMGAGAEIVVVPCNTIHAYLGPVLADQPVEFLSIIDTTVRAIQRRDARRVGLLATDGALASGVFQAALDAAGIEWLLPMPSQQEALMGVVDAVKAGRSEQRLHAQVQEMRSDLRERGAATTIAGCTEVSALLGDLSAGDDVDVIDPALELALRTIERATRS
ncbi:MAG: aspartate/glutamate racemase family protein [Ornithinimicrobium sp.]|uniref:aspartate/glutamate racemase family protein n=1 Tax=Ornithinimicrobium sp. TaxID=1977084 RepID=UPI003D9BAEB3